MDPVEYVHERLIVRKVNCGKRDLYGLASRTERESQVTQVRACSGHNSSRIRRRVFSYGET
jgi:hypothetical protein